MQAQSRDHEDFLRVRDLTGAELRALLDLAAAMKADPNGWRRSLQGETLALRFDKPSTRTRTSFAAAAWRLGMLPLELRAEELQLGRGESLEDTARSLSAYVSAIVVRTFEQRTLERLAEAASVPVVNALTDEHHPCQALADLLTLEERFGGLDGLELAYVGDGNNVAHSLVEASALAGARIAIASPSGYTPHPDVLAWARSIGGAVEVVDDPVAAVAGACAVYTDTWVSMGQDSDRDVRLSDLAPYRVDGALLSHARDDAIVLHCLPAHRGEEITDDVLDGPRSAIWQQAANRLPTQQALLHLLLAAGRGEVEDARASRRTRSTHDAEPVPA
jgi:ornithine carbamoyltransferase